MGLVARISFIFFFLSKFSLENFAADTTVIKILFIGNSLTYSNNLPALVQEIGKQDSVTVHVKSFCYPNYSLEDHWNEGMIQKEIDQGKYNYVVAQQGPSAMPQSQLLLMEYAKKLADLCKKNKTKLCFFTVWPSKARSFDLDDVITSYRKAAQETKSLLAPAGLAWKLAWQKNAALALYGADDFHPSLHGSLLSAMVIYASLQQRPDLHFLDNSNTSWKNEVTAIEMRLFKSAVQNALGSLF